MKKKTGLILGGMVLFSLVLTVGLVMGALATQTSSATVTVNSFLSVTIDDTTLPFPNLDPLQIGKPTNDPLVATIGPETNVGSIFVKTKANATDLVCTGAPCTTVLTPDKFAISNLDWDTATDAFPGNDYLTTDATVCTGLSANGACSIFHELTIPSAQAAGPYSVGITITATTT